MGEQTLKKDLFGYINQDINQDTNQDTKQDLDSLRKKELESRIRLQNAKSARTELGVEKDRLDLEKSKGNLCYIDVALCEFSNTLKNLYNSIKRLPVVISEQVNLSCDDSKAISDIIESLLIELFIRINNISIYGQSSVIYSLCALSCFILVLFINNRLFTSPLFWLISLPACFIGLIILTLIIFFIKRNEENTLNENLNRYKEVKHNEK